MRKFESINQVKGFLKRHLKASQIRFENTDTNNLIVRFTHQGVRYRLNANLGLLEQVIGDGMLEINETTGRILSKLNSVVTPKKPKEVACTPK